MNKFYFIIPAVLLGGFIFIYRGAVDEMNHKEAVIKAQIAADKAADDARRHEVEKIAIQDAEKRQKEREKEERDKQMKVEKSYNDYMNKIKQSTDALAAENAKLTKDIADLELALTNGRTLRDNTNHDAFELSKQVELEKINRRSAELEIQRLIEMLGTKAGASSLASMPVTPAKK